MQFAGRLPDDAPDPRVESAARVRALPFPVVGLTPQPSITDPGLFSFHGGTAVSRSYTLWRNPADPSDPVNLVELDDSTRAALDVMPTRQRPPWLIEIAESARYPMLWQAVRTSWNDDGHTRTSLPEQLVDHVNHVLRNRYRGRHGPQPDHVSDRDWPTSTATVNHRATARLDNADVDAVEIDTDPFVYGIGFWLRTDVAVTAVLPRDELEYLERSFITVGGR